MIITRLTKQGGGIIFRATPENLKLLVDAIGQIDEFDGTQWRGVGYLLSKLRQEAEAALEKAAQHGQQCFFVLPTCDAMLMSVAIHFLKMVDVGIEIALRKEAGEKDFSVNVHPEPPLSQFIVAVSGPLSELGLKEADSVVQGCLDSLAQWPEPPPACYLSMITHAYLQEFRARRSRVAWLRDLPNALNYDGAAVRAARKSLGEGDPESPWEQGEPFPGSAQKIVW